MSIIREAKDSKKISPKVLRNLVAKDTGKALNKKAVRLVWKVLAGREEESMKKEEQWVLPTSTTLSDKWMELSPMVTPKKVRKKLR